MNWQIDFHNRAVKFLKTNKVSQSKIIEVIEKSPKRLQGEDVSINIAKLKGRWLGFYRIKVGKLRIIADLILTTKRFILK